MSISPPLIYNAFLFKNRHYPFWNVSNETFWISFLLRMEKGRMPKLGMEIKGAKERAIPKYTTETKSCNGSSHYLEKVGQQVHGKSRCFRAIDFTHPLHFNSAIEIWKGGSYIRSTDWQKETHTCLLVYSFFSMDQLSALYRGEGLVTGNVLIGLIPSRPQSISLCANPLENWNGSMATS